MANPYFRFKQFTIYHHRSAMKVTTDACLFGAWCANNIAAVNPLTVLDAGTGTGLLSLLLAQKVSAQIDAVEIEGGAAAQAKENVAASPWYQRINIVHADLLQWPVQRKYDCIISNPPFYEDDLKSGSKNINLAHHSEALTLRALLGNLAERLQQQGQLYLLLPALREAQMLRLFDETGWYLHKLVHVQQSLRHPPFRLLVKAGRTAAAEVRSSTLSIKDDKDHYTPAFIALLKDYYLYL